MQENSRRIELAAEGQGKHQCPVGWEVFRSFLNRRTLTNYLGHRGIPSQYGVFENRMAKNSLQADSV